ncbi:MAG: SPOR domain-containing protein [Sphingomonadales bacterium]|nr:SPOR domain-containing protein [Sphingomonadales bacterium]
MVAGLAAGAHAHGAPPPPTNGPDADYPRIVGDPYVVDGKSFTPVDTMNYDAVGYADLGGEGGSAIAGAHHTLPIPSYVEVTALDSGHTILLRLTRRGPMTGTDLIALSPGAAAQLGLSGPRAAVRVRRVNPPEPERALLRAGSVAPLRMATPQSLLAVLRRKLSPDDSVELARTASTPPPPLPPAATSSPPPPTTTAQSEDAHRPPLRKPAVSGDTLIVQAGAFALKANALAAANRTHGALVQSGRLWTVRVGPFAARDQAALALAKVKGEGYSGARIQRAD